MLTDKIKPNYVGGLFKEEYHILEGEECVQYVQEYVPFHLPQIQFVLEKVFDNHFVNHENIRILDFGSGPATVPLAFCRIFEQNKYDQNIYITTIEASSVFNNHIIIFKKLNKNTKIKIEKNLKLDLTQDTLVNLIDDFDYDWIILANSFSIISQENNNDEINNYFYSLFQKILINKKMAVLSIIEGKYSSIINYIAQIEKIAKDGMQVECVKYINKQINVPYILNCEFYRTGLSVCKPYINGCILKLFYAKDNIGIKKN